MASLRASLVSLIILVPFFGACSEEEVSCDNERSGDFAVVLQLPEAECGEVEGTVTNIDTDEEFALSCEVKNSACECRGGDDFGVYRIELDYAERDEKQTALMDVSLSPSPQCVTREGLEAFSIVGGEGGSGGAGGSAPD